MDIRKQLCNIRSMLDGNLNRMTVTGDFEELEAKYNFAKKNLESLYACNKERLEKKRKLSEVFRND